MDIHTARPGIVIGKGGSEVDALRSELERLTKKKVQVNVREVSRPGAQRERSWPSPSRSSSSEGPRSGGR